MKWRIEESRLVLLPEGDAERIEFEKWRGPLRGHVLEIAGNNGDALVLEDLGLRERACREPINITSRIADPALRLIGNFAPTPFLLDGIQYASVESFWQSLKFDDEAERAQIAGTPGSEAKGRGDAKGYGAFVRHGGAQIPTGTFAHWQLMEMACRAKFTQNPDALSALLSTAPRPLEHRVRHDSRTIPGVIMAGIWMRLREELGPVCESPRLKPRLSPAMPPPIFITYAPPDRHAAEAVSRALEDAGLATWVEWRDMATGVRWEWAVRHALKGGGVLVLILSQWAAHSEYVVEACEIARELDVPVVTLCFEEGAVPGAALEAFFQPELWLDCFEQPLDAKASLLIAMVEKLLPVAPQPAPRGDAPKPRRPPPAAEDPFPGKGSLADRPGMFCCKCGADNPDMIAGCRVCGASMLLALKSEETFASCSVCTSINPPFADFCRVCGSSFHEPPPAAEDLPPSERPTEPAPPGEMPPRSEPCGPESVGHRAGQWLLARLMGRGGQGSVFEAIHVYLRTPAALKVMHSDAGTRPAANPGVGEAIRRGLRGLARLDSPHVAKLLDFGEAEFSTGRRHYLVTELVRGPAVRDILPELAKPGADPLARALRIFRQLCLGVQAAHGVSYFDDAGFELIGVRHGDIKPANVLLAAGDAVKLIDFLLFGLGDSFGPASDTPTRACGTPGYMAPEQMERGEITIATDIYSLGATLLQMLTLALPPDIGNMDGEAALRSALEPMNPDAAVCAPVLCRCLARDPARRFASVAELLAHLPAT